MSQLTDGELIDRGRRGEAAAIGELFEGHYADPGGRDATTPLRTEIPDPGLLPHRYQRKTPYNYSDEEIASLLRRAAQLPSAKGLRAPTYTTLFGISQ